jgi:hypothetical protein
MPDPTSGEKRGYREAMDRMTSQLVSTGTAPDKAREIAREQAVRADREGKRVQE